MPSSAAPAGLLAGADLFELDRGAAPVAQVVDDLAECFTLVPSGTGADQNALNVQCIEKSGMAVTSIYCFTALMSPSVPMASSTVFKPPQKTIPETKPTTSSVSSEYLVLGRRRNSKYRFISDSDVIVESWPDPPGMADRRPGNRRAHRDGREDARALCRAAHLLPNRLLGQRFDHFFRRKNGPYRGRVAPANVKLVFLDLRQRKHQVVEGRQVVRFEVGDEVRVINTGRVVQLALDVDEIGERR